MVAVPRSRIPVSLKGSVRDSYNTRTIADKQISRRSHESGIYIQEQPVAPFHIPLVEELCYEL